MKTEPFPAQGSGNLSFKVSFPLCFDVGSWNRQGESNCPGRRNQKQRVRGAFKVPVMELEQPPASPRR